jgi:hypothetical protein
MTDQTPETTAVDDGQVEPEKTTNPVDEQDDVEIDENQTPVGLPDIDDDGNEVELDDGEGDQ